MNEIKKEISKNNSSNDLTNINATNLINKPVSNKKEIKNKRPIQKIKTAFKKDTGTGDFRINEKSVPEFKFKRVWSTQNILLYNLNKTSKYRKSIFNQNFNFYSGASIYSAPSVKDNRIEITKLLRNSRNKRINYINNIHNNLMIQSSKQYRKKINFFSKDNSFENEAKNNLKRKYNMNDMNAINNIKLNLNPNFKRYFTSKKRNRIFSCYDLSLKRYKIVKKDINSKKNYNNDNTIGSNKTNYLSKYFSGKKTMKTIYEKKTNKTNEINSLSNNSKIFSAGTANILNKNNNNNKIFQYIKKKPLLKNYSKDYLKESNKSDRPDNNSYQLYKEIEISKMSLELNDIIFNKKRKVNKLNELEMKLIKYKTLKEFQEDRLGIMSKQDINGLKNRIFLLQENIKKYNQISIEYFLKINNYLHFLKDKKYSLSNYFDEQNNKRFNLYFDIEKLVTDNVLKQKELEHLIEVRHFLIQVKNTLIKQPNYFNNILKEKSRKYELGRLILSLKILPQNQNVIKFLESIPEIKDVEVVNSSPLLQAQSRTDINKASFKKKSKKFSQVSVLKSKISNTIITKYLNFPDKQIFETPEEFIIILDNIESKNLRLMKENDYINRNIDILRKEYNEIYQSNKIMEKYNDINQKEEKLKQLIKENLVLREKYNFLKDNKNEDEENNFKNAKKGETRSFFMDLSIFKKITYYKLIKNYKYKGLLLLDRLIEIVKDFFAENYTNYGIEKAYGLIEKNVIIKIFSINKKNINNLNRMTINYYILCLLKLYENICQFIKFKDIEYNSIKQNKYIIHKKKEEIQLNRKIKNTRTIRQLAEEKRINGIEKIVKRNNKPNLLFKGNVDENIVLKNKIKRNKKLKEMGKNKHNLLEKEFNFYVSYNND